MSGKQEWVDVGDVAQEFWWLGFLFFSFFFFFFLITNRVNDSV